MNIRDKQLIKRMRNMKILHLTKKYPEALGGDAIVVHNLEKQQKKNGKKIFKHK